MQDAIDSFRAFNRFYTHQLGLLDQTLLDTDFSLTQARILFEIAQRSDCTARQLVNAIDLDPGYVSRMISAFEVRGLIRKIQSEKDSREKQIKLTPKGKKVFASLNQRSSREAQMLLERLTAENRERLLHSMRTIQSIVSPPPLEQSSVILRGHRAGDIGWITFRHGVLYADEYGWDETFEALVADILVKFINKQNRNRERIWIAELFGERVGSVMLVDSGNDIAQLRLLLVEPWARGRKIGKLLVDECTTFARDHGYKKIKLWTQSNLVEARSLYMKSGYKVVEQNPHRSFGQDLIAEIWELAL